MKKLIILTALLMLTACQPKSNASETAEKEKVKNSEEMVIKIEEDDKKEQKEEKEVKDLKSDNQEASENTKESDIPRIVEENLTAMGVVKEVDHNKAYLILDTKEGDIRFDKYDHAIINSMHDRKIGPDKINLKDELSISYMKMDDKIIATQIKNLSNSEGSSVFIPVEQKQEFEEKYQKMAYDALYQENLKTRQKNGEFLIVYPEVVDSYEDENVLKLYTINNYSWFVLWDNNELEGKSAAVGEYLVIEYTKTGSELKFKIIHKMEADGALTGESVKKLVVDKPEVYDKFINERHKIDGVALREEAEKLLDLHGYKHNFIEN